MERHVFELISPGDRGPAVEDVQKRLLTLGYDLGPTGIDGVFLGATHSAVRRFQAEHHLAEDGVIGDETWSALVDATFTLGDRLLYLRLPHFHGADVARLQGALNVLGFTCGEPDGIFGAYTERAVREFQANVGLPADGIAGPETVRTIERLGHVWEGKDPEAPASLAVGPARTAQVLRTIELVLIGSDRCGRAVAERVANLVRASDGQATVSVADDSRSTGRPSLTLRITCELAAPSAGIPAIVIMPDASVEGRFIAALGVTPPPDEVILVLPADVSDAEQQAQACAVHVLDGICAALSSVRPAVLP
jgi:peptidoglycan hydrolase-like protein with peptidoglycan-binding domain